MGEIIGLFLYQTFYIIVSQTKSVVDVNSPCRESGNTPLHAAANWGYAEMVTLLLEKGEADVNATNPQCDHATPLHLSVMQGNGTSLVLVVECQIWVILDGMEKIGEGD